MITVLAGLRVLIATKPIDFRKGADGLAALVRETLGDDPFSGSIYVFRTRRRRRSKAMWRVTLRSPAPTACAPICESRLCRHHHLKVGP
jgi:transposase